MDGIMNAIGSVIILVLALILAVLVLYGKSITKRYSPYDLCRNNGFILVDYGRGAKTICEDQNTRAIIFVID